MNLKEEYIKLRNENKLNVDFLYKYYLEKTDKTPVTLSVFLQVIQFGNIDEIFKTLDKEYCITTLQDKDGIFIKVVE
jgi:hypothetical protein